MTELARGLYEHLITQELEARLAALPSGSLHPVTSEIEPAEAADRFAVHLSRVIARVVSSLPERERVRRGTALARDVIDLIDAAHPSKHVPDDRPAESGEMLHALVGRRPDGSHETIQAPLTPLLDTTLLTNAPGEPRVGTQVATEVPSADRIDLVMAFIRRSGIRPMLAALRAHCGAGRELRVLTTTYTNSTEAAALDELRGIGADVRVSYDTSGTRLHAKAWLFHRASGFSTAYIGSSNLTRSAQVTGLEWNVRVSAARNADVIEKVVAVFESYWQLADFRPYEPDEFRERVRSASATTASALPLIELEPRPFQERLLERIALARRRGRHRNLLVAATGTGKTVMAAVDYARLRATLPRSRLLFVAHRREILQQSQLTFRMALRDNAFGELWVGGARPEAFEHVFASIQSLHASTLAHLPPDHFDVVILDEFHHAAAPSYRRLLEHIAPRELLGLTATPERSDGLEILEWFDGDIAAELRLWDAIDQQRLVPFLYFGIHDGTDLTHVPWKRGQGYDVDGLTQVLTADEALARFVLRQLIDHANDPEAMRVLGFCVSVAHARFMARVFTEAGIASRAVWGDTPEEERRDALRALSNGHIRVLFSVDLFNEGVDVPTVDTLLLLRPTDSATLFIQQLGRGLRRAAGKSACTVLDFVAQHRREFRFDRKLRALLGGTRRDIEKQITAGFPLLPAGCHMELDAVASDIVLDNLRSALPTLWAEKASELKALAEASGGDVGLERYLDATGLELDSVYASGKGWSDLRETAGLIVAEAGPYEVPFRRACGRLRHIDDLERLGAYRQFLAAPSPPDIEVLTERRRRLLRMLITSVLTKKVDKGATLQEGAHLLWQHPQVIQELRQLLDVLDVQVEHIHHDLTGHPDVPLQVHARYTRAEILAAFDVGHGARTPSWQTGVYWAKNAGADLMAFTLDKTSGHFSPTTRYNDYAISPELIHWESQSVTRAESETGRRYREHETRGTWVMLFTRRDTREKAFWFLGPATYVRHESEKPMKVIWRLQHRLPGDLFAAFAAAVA